MKTLNEFVNDAEYHSGVLLDEKISLRRGVKRVRDAWRDSKDWDAANKIHDRAERWAEVGKKAGGPPGAFIGGALGAIAGKPAGPLGMAAGALGGSHAGNWMGKEVGQATAGGAGVLSGAAQSAISRVARMAKELRRNKYGNEDERQYKRDQIMNSIRGANKRWAKSVGTDNTARDREDRKINRRMAVLKQIPPSRWE